MQKVVVYDPTANDQLSKVRGVGRYIQILRENFPDWIFINNLAIKQFDNFDSVFINPFFNFLQKPVSIRRIAKKQIAVIHDLIPFKYPAHFPSGIQGRFNIFKNSLALRNYDLIVTDSEASKKDIIQILGVKEGKIRVIYPCLPKIFTSTKHEIRSTKQIQNSNFEYSKIVSDFDIRTLDFCLYVGDVTWNKNLVNIAKAIKQADVTCVFVGKNFSRKNLSSSDNFWKNEFNELLKIVRDDKHFIFAGFLHDRELIKLYQQADVNILVSQDEGFGFSYLEAASQSCPSLLSETDVLFEIAEDSAIFANPESPREIAEQIKKLFKNEELKTELSKKAKKRADFFSAEQFKKNYLDLISN